MRSKPHYASAIAVKNFRVKSFVTGFSLVEPIIASLLLVITAVQIATLFEINLRGIENSGTLDDADLEIHQMIDTLRNLGDSYNWCADPGVLDAIQSNPNSINRGGSMVSDCGGALVENPKAYYAHSLANSNLDDFIRRCLNTEAKATDASAANDKIIANLAATMAGLGETISSDGVKVTPEFEDHTLRRFKIKLERTVTLNGADRTLTRWLYLVPPLASWCPS
jgi:hypothetical protein